MRSTIFVTLCFLGVTSALSCKELPKNPFVMSADAENAIENGPLSLKVQPPKIKLPFLGEEILYLGTNERPDQKETLFHLQLKRSKETKESHLNQKIYLTYSLGAYHFSKDNSESPLWMELTHSNDETLDVSVFLKDGEGEILITPVASHKLTLTAQIEPRNAPFEISGQKVDASFFLRQHARFVGKDTFLEVHGGDAFSFAKGRERVDFLEGEKAFSCFIREGDLLIWKERNWVLPQEGEETTKFPLLHVKKVDERSASFDLWDVAGKTKVSLNLPRSKTTDMLPDLASEFKFIGAKTWTQFILECRGARYLLHTDDWLLLTQEGWKKLSTPEEIDDYVNRKLVGPLLVIGKMAKNGVQQALIANLYSLSRTEMKEVNLSQSSL